MAPQDARRRLRLDNVEMPERSDGSGRLLDDIADRIEWGEQFDGAPAANPRQHPLRARVVIGMPR